MSGESTYHIGVAFYNDDGKLMRYQDVIRKYVIRDIGGRKTLHSGWTKTEESYHYKGVELQKLTNTYDDEKPDAEYAVLSFGSQDEYGDGKFEITPKHILVAKRIQVEFKNEHRANTKFGMFRSTA